MTKVGLIGLGTMGLPMAKNIIKAGYEVYGYDVNHDRIELLVQAGGISTNSVIEITKQVDVLITMVPASTHAIAVYNLVKEAADGDLICINMSTIEPEIHNEIRVELESCCVKMLDAPVVKSEAAAIAGTLGIYVGGDKETYNTVEPILKCMGKDVMYLGDAGRGMLMKICHNMLVAEIQNGLNEMLCLAQAGGLDAKTAVEAARLGGAANAYMDTKIDNIVNSDYKPAFSVANMHKDLYIAKTIMNEKSLYLAGLENCCDVYNDAMQERSSEDFSSTYEVVKVRSYHES